MEKRINTNACKVFQKIKRANKRTKAAIKCKECKVAVYEGEVEKPEEIYNDWLYSIEDYR